MNKQYNIKFYCNKCKKELKWNLNSDFDLSDGDIDRFTRDLSNKHNYEEHSYCFNCGKKINPKEAESEIVGRQDPSPEEMKKGVAFTILFGHFCKECYFKLSKKKENEEKK